MIITDSITSPRRHPPATSIPLAVERVGQRLVHHSVPVDPRTSHPTDRWWAELRAEVAAECETTLCAHERDEAHLDVAVVDTIEVPDPDADDREKAAAFDALSHQLAVGGNVCIPEIRGGHTKRVRVPPYLQIQVTPAAGWMLDRFRLYTLRYEAHQLTLDPVSHNAWCEMWRSLYAPEVARDEKERRARNRRQAWDTGRCVHCGEPVPHSVLCEGMKADGWTS